MDWFSHVENYHVGRSINTLELYILEGKEIMK